MMIIDAHCDTLMALADPENSLNAGSSTHVTYTRLHEGGVALQICALFAGVAGPNGKGKAAPRAQADAQLQALPQLIANGMRQVSSPLEITSGQPHIMLSIEGGEIIGDSLEALHYFYGQGVRLFSLTWDHENLLGYPHCKDGQNRLKPFGWDVVRELTKLGIALDVSHLGEGGFWDIIFHAEKPPVASHSCCRALCNRTRNLTNDQIRALIDAGGWIGVNFYTSFLSETEKADIHTLITHIAHIAELGGVSNVGFGSDFDGINAPPVGLEHPGKMPALLTALNSYGFSSSEVEGIAGKNFLRYMQQIEKAV